MSALLILWRSGLLQLWDASWVVLPLIALAWWGRRCSARVLHLVWSLALIAIVVPHSLWRVALPSFSLPGVEFAALPPIVTLEALRVTPVGTAGAAGAGLTALLIAATVLWSWGAGRSLRRLAREVGEARRLARSSECVWVPSVEAEAARLGIPADRVRVCAQVKGPVTVGFLRPLILLPPEGVASLSTTELRAVLAHEDHHRRRRDPLRILLGRALQAILFFYPPIYLVLRGLAETNELLADRAALHHVDRASYTSALSRSLRGALITEGPLFAGLGRSASLAARWDRIQNPRRYQSMTRGITLILTSVACVTLGALFACSPEPRDQSIPSTQSPTTAATTNDGASLGAEPADTPPMVRPGQLAVNYPEAERNAGVTGTVIVRMLVEADGTTTDATIQQSIEGHPAFDDEVLRVVKQARFTPATKSGQPVAAWVQIPIKFSLN